MNKEMLQRGLAILEKMTNAELKEFLGDGYEEIRRVTKADHQRQFIHIRIVVGVDEVSMTVSGPNTPKPFFVSSIGYNPIQVFLRDVEHIELGKLHGISSNPYEQQFEIIDFAENEKEAIAKAKLEIKKISERMAQGYRDLAASVTNHRMKFIATQ